MPRAKLPIQCLNEALTGYLGAIYAPDDSPWRIVGISPQEPGGVAGQLITNGCYYTCYACEGTYGLLATEGRKGGDELLQKLRNLYVRYFGGIRKTPRRAAGAGAGARGRDQAGRLRLSGKDAGWVRKRFFEEWMLPPTARSVEEALVETLGKADGEGPAVAGLIKGVANRMLGELRFYRQLHTGEHELAKEAFDFSDPEDALLGCYQTLLPIWVFTQATHASAEDPGLLLNLFTLDFWGASESLASGGPAPFQELIDNICACYANESPLEEAHVEALRERALELFSACVQDDMDVVLKAFEGGRARPLPMVEELFERSLRGEWSPPAWASRRAELIYLVMVACCVGIDEALGVNRVRMTTDRFAELEHRLEDVELGSGSGVVPLGVSVGDRDYPSVNLRLVDDAPDGVVCVLGSAQDPTFWSVTCMEQAREAFARFFSVETHLDAARPDSLLARLRAAGERVLDFELGHFVGQEDLQAAREGLRCFLDEELRGCLGASFEEDEDGPELDRGSEARADEGTLCGAVGRAADRLQLWLDARLLAGDVIPRVRAALFDALWSKARGYFKEQLTLRPEGDGSQLDALLDQLEDECAARHGHDPSMRFAVAQLRSILRERFKNMHRKTIRLHDLVAVTSEILGSVGRAERFVELMSEDVSRRHAVLYLEGGQLRIADAGSLFGTAVLRDQKGATRAWLLEGSSRTRLDEMRGSSWMPPERAEATTMAVCRGDALRLAGQSVVRVGNRP